MLKIVSQLCWLVAMASLKMFIRRRSSAVDQYIETMRGDQLRVRVWFELVNP